jgi:hypothetical protein
MKRRERRCSHRRVAAGAGLLLCAFAASSHSKCPLSAEDGTVVVDNAVQVAWRAESGSIAVGQPFVMLIAVCPADAQLARVDATMPEHRHGMNYRPSLQSLGGGRWRVEGLLWHMAGRWELQFDVRAADQVHGLRHSVTLQ